MSAGMWIPWYRDLVEASMRVTKQSKLEEKYIGCG